MNEHAARRAPGRWLRRLAITLVVLLVIAVVLDRGGDYVAERIAADNLQSSQHLDSRPDVDIDGVPFLTQFASGTYDHITLEAKDVPVKDAFSLSHLHVDLHRLTVSRGFTTFHVGTATATAVVSYADLSAKLGIDVSYAGTGRIRASKAITLPVTGTVTPTITVAPKLVDGALSFGTSTINGAGDNLGAVSSALNQIFGTAIPLDGIPFDVKARSLTVDRSGLTLTLVGADLTYSGNN